MSAAPAPHSALLVNHFLLQTTSFLNDFSALCDERLAEVSAKVTRLETLLQILEAKLQSPSILSICHSSSSSSAKDPASEAREKPATSSTTPSPAALENVAADEVVSVAPPGMVLAREHPACASYFKMLNVGVPLQAVKMKATADGQLRNVDWLDDPEKLLPLVVGAPEETKAEPSADANADADAEMVVARIHPKCAKYFKMLDVGIPREAVKMKATADGALRNLEWLDDPERLVPVSSAER